MINADARLYDYFTLGEKDGYGQPQLPDPNSAPAGQIKMAVNIITQAITDNIKYKDSNYLGLTQEQVNDTYIIKYENKMLKVLYVNPKGRYKQVFMAEM